MTTLAGAIDDSPHTYPVSFSGSIDLPTAERIASVVKSVVDAASDSGPLRFLDQVIFAEDYERALTELDRGFKASEDLRTTSVSYGTGVAMAPLVVRAGEVRCVLIMRLWVGRALLEDDETFQRSAMHTLVCMMARVNYMSRVHDAFPNFLLKPVDDPWDAFFIRYVDSLSSAYFGARAASKVDPDAGEAFRTLFRDSLAAATDLIPRHRLAYRTSADLDGLLRVTFSSLSDVLTHAASALGHFDGLNAELFASGYGPGIEELLRSRSLLKWFDLYRRDLRRIYERCGEWESPKHLLAVSIHLERLLWSFGIFLWRTDGGEMRAEIPLHTDIAALQARGTGSDT